MEMSYPVLGPDEFVVSALKGQVHRHGARKVSQLKGVSAKKVIRLVFESLSLDPVEASSSARTPKISRSRILAAYVWMKRLGNSQISLADALRVSPIAMTKMMAKLRQKGLKKEEKRLVAKTLKALLEKEGGKSLKARSEPTEPKIIILKRQRS